MKLWIFLGMGMNYITDIKMANALIMILIGPDY